MKRLKYVISRIFKMDFKNMFKIAKKISKKTKRPRLFILIDMVICGFKYGAGYYDYQEFEFYLLKGKERKTYLTRAKNNQIISTYNDGEYVFLTNHVKSDLIFRSWLSKLKKECIKHGRMTSICRTRHRIYLL